MGVRVEFTDRHGAIDGLESGHDGQLGALPHDFHEHCHVHVFLLKERVEPMLTVVAHEAFRGVPGETDGSHDVLVFTDPCGDLLYTLRGGWALP